MYKDTLVCNYAPAGNYINNPVYIRGPPGTGCGVRSVLYPNLCADFG